MRQWFVLFVEVPGDSKADRLVIESRAVQIAFDSSGKERSPLMFRETLDHGAFDIGQLLIPLSRRDVVGQAGAEAPIATRHPKQGDLRRA